MACSPCSVTHVPFAVVSTNATDTVYWQVYMSLNKLSVRDHWARGHSGGHDAIKAAMSRERFDWVRESPSASHRWIGHRSPAPIYRDGALARPRRFTAT